MTWDEETLEMLRLALSDDETPYTYSDDKLNKLFLLAARYVQQEIVLPYEYTIDIVNITLSPDPSALGDYLMINLGVLKAICILHSSALSLATGKNFSIQDGGTLYKSGDTYGEKSGVAKTACEAYADYKEQYILDNPVSGQCIVTPFAHDRLYISPYGVR